MKGLEIDVKVLILLILNHMQILNYINASLKYITAHLNFIINANIVSRRAVVVTEPSRLCQRQCINRLVLVKESARQATRLSLTVSDCGKTVSLQGVLKASVFLPYFGSLSDT